MEENSIIKLEQAQERKVEIIKDINPVLETEKEIADKKEQERKERVFLIQLIVVFLTWIFLIYLLMRSEKKEQQKVKKAIPKPKTAPKAKMMLTKHTKIPKRQTQTLKSTPKHPPKEEKPQIKEVKSENKEVKSKTKEENPKTKIPNDNPKVNHSPKQHKQEKKSKN